MTKTVLALDIGGTNSRLALYSYEKNKIKLVSKEVYPTHDVKTYEKTIYDFIKEKKVNVKNICIGFAGPVTNGRATLTNAGITIDIKKIKKKLDFRQAYLLNDFYVAAAGVNHLLKKDIFEINKGKKIDSKIKVVIGPGTGLGEAHIIDEKIYPGEPGYATISSQSDLEYNLIKHLQKKYKTQVYWEDILSGRGLVGIYDFLDSHKKYAKNKIYLEIKKSGLKKGYLITDYESKNKLCKDTVELFSTFYGRFVRDTALKLLPSHIFLAGGISPDILPITKKVFLDEYLKNRKYSEILKKVSLKLILNRDLGLVGSAAIAFGLQKV
ncbi:ROK family protein [archaeon]|jgi:glucokinase|nr:ROK family protein [archaeon]MBT4351741.1 ROK family protein [archaeon]MBT6822043.1 ROK family protein [archaeon]MBT7391429.1 ROK family protein [archaeon]